MSQAVRSSISGTTNIATTVGYLAPAVGVVTSNATVVRAGLLSLKAK